MTLQGRPTFIRSDNGPEFTAMAVIDWLTKHNIGPDSLNRALHGKMPMWRGNPPKKPLFPKVENSSKIMKEKKKENFL